MKKFLLSTILPAIVLMALNSNAAPAPNYGPLTISWTILEQKEAVTNSAPPKSTKSGKSSTNTVYAYKATTSSSNFTSISLLNLISNSFGGTNFAKGDKLATDGENIFVVDSSGADILGTNLADFLTVSYLDPITSGSATVTTNTSTTNFTVTPKYTYSASTNNTNAVVLVIEVTNINTNISYTTNAYETNIDTTTSTNYYYSTTNVLYTTVTNITTNYSAESVITNTVTNIYTYTNIYTTIIGNVTNSTTTYTYYTNTITMSMMLPTNEYAIATNYVTNYATTNTGTTAYTTTSYFFLNYYDPATSNNWCYSGLATTAADVNIGKDTGTENFAVKDGSGYGLINGKTALISGTMAGSAKGKASPPPE